MPSFKFRTAMEDGKAVLAGKEKSEEIKLQEEQNKTAKKMRRKKKEQILFDLRQMDVDDIKCGIGTCTPNWLQVCARREIYLIVYCIVGLVMGMFFTYTVSTISTLEKRFRLTSKQTGIILAGNDVSQVLLSMLVTYYGNYGNRPKWLGFGVLSASFSCLLAALPHFMYGPGQDAVDVANAFSHSLSNGSASPTSGLTTTNKNDLCHSPYIEDCENHEGDTAYLGPVIILFLAEFLVGIAVTVYYSLGIVYLDDNVNKKDSPLYYAISMIIRVVGPVLGFFMGSKCLAIYIDPKYKPNISMRDPRWLGAWWLGFLILSALLAISGILILFFPRILPVTLYKQILKLQKSEESRAATEKQPANTDMEYLIKLTKIKQRIKKPSIKKLPLALKRLFTNKVWFGYNFNTVLYLLALMGYWSFKPKYLEYQFRKSASEATFYTGLASLVASILGLGISGIIIRVLRPGPRFITLYACFLTVFSSLSMASLMFIGCPKVDIKGPNLELSNGLASCNADCGCTDRYSPVCSQDGLTTFYSPCYAGCTSINSSAAPVEYYNCKCLQPGVSSSNFSVIETTQVPEEVAEQWPRGETIQGYCPETCDAFFYYIIVTIITKAIESTGRIGGTLIYLRSVEEEDKGLALGMTTLLISLFAFIPGPIIMGAIVDAACIIWDNTCGVIGNCWLYDSDQFRIIIHGFPAALIMVSIIGDIIVYIYSKDLVLYGEDEEEKIDPAAEELKELSPVRNGASDLP